MAAAADSAHYLDPVAGVEVIAVEAAARHDFPIDLHRQARRLQAQVGDQRAGAEPVGQLFGFAVDDKFHGAAFYRKSCISVDSMHK